MSDLKTVLNSSSFLLLNSQGICHRTKWNGHKWMLAYDAHKENWQIVKLNIVQLFIRKVLGLYKSTHLSSIVEGYNKQKNLYRNTLLEQRLADIWRRTYPNSQNNLSSPFVILGNTTPDKAQIFCFPEEHHDRTGLRQRYGEVINRYYRPGDIILVEGWESHKPATKAGQISDMLQHVNPDYPVRGWEPENYADIMTKVMPSYPKFKQMSDHISNVEYINRMAKKPANKEELNQLLKGYREIASYFIKDSNAVDNLTKQIEKFYETCDEVSFRYAMNKMVALLHGNVNKKLFNLKGYSDIYKTILDRNMSLCKEIDKHARPGVRVFIPAGAAHFLNMPSYNTEKDVIQIKSTLKKYPYVVFADRKLFCGSKLGESNPDLKEQLFV